MGKKGKRFFTAKNAEVAESFEFKKKSETKNYSPTTKDFFRTGLQDLLVFLLITNH